MPPQASTESTGDRHEERAKHPKRPSKRKQRVQTSATVQSQDDGGDEVVWIVSPTAERLQSKATGGPLVRVVGEGRSVLQPCNTSHNRIEPVLDILSKKSTLNSAKKKKSPGMAGKLELWLSSSQQVHASRASKAIAREQGKADLEDDKENKTDGGAENDAECKKVTSPTISKTCSSNSKRPSTSTRRRSLSAQKNVSTSLLKATPKKPGQRRKALLDLLDKVDDALIVKGPMLVQSKLIFNRKVMSPVEENHSHADEQRTTPKVEEVHFRTALLPSPEPVHATEEHGYRFSCNESDHAKGDAPAGPGDCNTDVITKVQILDIRSESKGLVQLPPITSLDNQEDVQSGAQTPLGMSCYPGSDVLKNKTGIRFLVLQVNDGEYKESFTSLYPQKILTLLDEENGIARVAHLRDTWFHAVVEAGDTVNVIGEFDVDGKCVIDREHNLLVVNPDLLVSGSKVGSSFSCPRRAVLDERIKSNEVSYPALMGTMLHQLFQVALHSEHPTPSLLNGEAKLIVQRQLDGLYATGVSDREACMNLVAVIPTILSWWQQYVGVKISAAQEIEFGKVHGTQPAYISEVVDIEEMVWSPKYGLKGMMDASVMVKMSNVNLRVEDHIMPLELKTGKATTGQAATEHRAQVILYTLLMSDRYMQRVGAGLLYYLHTNQTQGVEAQQTELVGLMMRRNEHANSLLKASSDQSLPPMLQNYHMCQGCRQLDTCTLYHKAQEKGTGESSGLGELFDRSTSHLSNTHVQFFQKWDRLIDLEAQHVLVSHSQVWRMPSRQREEAGRCISSLVLEISANKSNEQQISGNAFMYTFRRASSYESSNPVADVSQSSQASFYDRPFSCGDYVLLSTESGHSAVAGGTIMNISENFIVLRLPHRLRIPGKPQTPGNVTSLQDIWRIDKDETASSLAIMRFNLLQLFLKTNGDGQRRGLIVDLQVPKFESNPDADPDPAALYLRSVKDLNDDQIRAINRVIAARDYALILGLPGTGKTSTIVHAVIALLARKSSVLLTSYTNSAVDNILLRLKKLGVDFIRVGRTEAIHPELREQSLGGLAVTSVKEFQAVVDKAQVVGVTCLGISNALFSKRKFDVCIVDEAGQITLPVCLGPLRCARSFVLVGDHYQLPPLVRSSEAREEGMAVSLFRLLSESHPQSISVLQSQYRMCSGIMALSNSLIYGDRLCCGSPLVANASLVVRESSDKLPHWLLQVVDPMQRLLFLDTDQLSAEESRLRSNIKNPAEASILLRIVQVLYNGGVDIGKIGVISPYNAQVDLIQRQATKAGFPNLEVHTVDKYQGREKDCVLISFIRSNSKCEITGLVLADWRRINVAITRAKTKLVMVGSQKTLSSTPILRLLIQKVAEVGCLLPLPPNANIDTFS